ncbi:dnaJ homolog subfamily C member 22 [Protopterus annectens]|uniref:dnaJ homolog subfamily C member 22 n=1 Tax=Protopterus annectens TaxID=7888 RepID=UPI001CFA43D8|nr:dnaJ homolog subfamily C member 22 [Protopterus annectens]XP_043939613.1 dnaJ homolog subfamily C member 22 [Protopterus annectens]
MGKSYVVTYVLWGFGGLFGFHHIYLGRDSHALLWMVTLGGFGMGWVLEFWKIPSYVMKANRKQEDLSQSHRQKPSMSIISFFAQIIVGIYFGIVAIIGLSSLNTFYFIMLPLAVGLGIHLVASISEETSDLRKTLTAAGITSLIFYERPIAILPVSIVASIISQKNRRIKTPSVHDNFSVRAYRLGLAYLAFYMPLAYLAIHNTVLTAAYIKDIASVILDLFTSFLFFPYTVWKTFTSGYGFFQEWEKIIKLFNSLQGETAEIAYKTLGLEDGATMEEISKMYKELVKLWHPDHNPDHSEEAEKRFIEIQTAYKMLKKLKKSAEL